MNTKFLGLLMVAMLALTSCEKSWYDEPSKKSNYAHLYYITNMSSQLVSLTLSKDAFVDIDTGVTVEYSAVVKRNATEEVDYLMGQSKQLDSIYLLTYTNGEEAYVVYRSDANGLLSPSAYQRIYSFDGLNYYRGNYETCVQKVGEDHVFIYNYVITDEYLGTLDKATTSFYEKWPI